MSRSSEPYLDASGKALKEQALSAMNRGVEELQTAIELLSREIGIGTEFIIGGLADWVEEMKKVKRQIAAI